MKAPSNGGRERLAAAAALARDRGLDTLPNPPVGCLLVSGAGEVVGEGFHRGYGLPHAEAEALAAAAGRARGATAFVTLEPCAAAGAGKRTPPCAGALLAAGVARVVYACEDPDPCAAGAGPALLAGGVVVERVECAEAEELLPRWRAAAADPLPWTIAKWAMTLDGKIADARGGSRWISSDASRARVHELRARVDAVVVGARTAVQDDPDLRPRLPGGGPARMPLRIVVDRSLSLPARGRLASSAREAPVLCAAGAAPPESRRRALEDLGVEVLSFPGPRGRVDIRALFAALRRRGMRRVLIEGGGPSTRPPSPRGSSGRPWCSSRRRSSGAAPPPPPWRGRRGCAAPPIPCAWRSCGWKGWGRICCSRATSPPPAHRPSARRSSRRRRGPRRW